MSVAYATNERFIEKFLTVQAPQYFEFELGHGFDGLIRICSD